MDKGRIWCWSVVVYFFHLSHLFSSLQCKPSFAPLEQEERRKKGFGKEKAKKIYRDFLLSFSFFKKNRNTFPVWGALKFGSFRFLADWKAQEVKGEKLYAIGGWLSNRVREEKDGSVSCVWTQRKDGGSVVRTKIRTETGMGGGKCRPVPRVKLGKHSAVSLWKMRTVATPHRLQLVKQSSLCPREMERIVAPGRWRNVFPGSFGRKPWYRREPWICLWCRYPLGTADS